MSLHRQVARKAFVYGVPTVALYRALHEQVLAPVRPGRDRHLNRVDHGHVPAWLSGAPASTTLDATSTFSGWLDLRSGPIALRVLPARLGRTASASVLDLYAEPLACISSPVSAPGRRLLLAGPSWEPELTAPTAPTADVTELHRCRTDLCLVVGRSASSSSPDHVRDLRPPVVVQPCSPPSDGEGAVLRWPRPVDPVDVGRPPTTAFLAVLDWILALMPTPPGEEELRAELELVGVGAGPDALDDALAVDSRDGQLTEGLRRGFDDVRRSILADRERGGRPDTGPHLARAARVLARPLLPSASCSPPGGVRPAR